MSNPEERELVRKFLEDYKKILEDRTGIPFHPRHLAIIAQPDMKDDALLEWIAYHKWFDEVDYGISNAKSNNIIQAFLEMPIHILIEAEELGKPMLSEKDSIKLAQALQLISEISVKRQFENEK